MSFHYILTTYTIERECVMFLPCPRHSETVAMKRLRDQVAPLFRANFGSSRSLQGTLAKFRKFLSLPQPEIPQRLRTLCENVRDLRD